MADSKKDLIQYRLDNAKEKLNSSKLLLDSGNYKDSIGRSYYAMFTAVRVILANDGVDFSKHVAVIAYFQQHYVKTRIFEVKYSKYISNAFQVRNNADYADFYIVSEKDALEQYNKAVEFYDAVYEYINKN